jgi:predicted Zn-dependent protease
MLQECVSRRWRWLILVPALALGLVARAQAPLNLPALGDGAEWALGEERQLGNNIMGQIWRDPDVIDDPVLLQYMQDIWSPLLAVARQRGEVSNELRQRFAWELFLVRDRTVNAFALPGGYMGVHLGLIAVSSNRDELASVLGHETSHITQRHIARMLAQQDKSTPLMIGTMLLGILAASRSPDAAGALLIGGQAAALQNQLSFSRDMEREADRVGFSLLEPAGFHPEGAITLFDKLIQAARLNDSGAYPYLRSHPMSTERMADMAGRAQQLGPITKAPTNDLVHAMMTARARALTDTSADAQRKLVLAARDQSLTPDAASASWVSAIYAGVMAHMQARQFETAQTLLAALSRALKGSTTEMDQVHWLAAELAMRQNKIDAALGELGQVTPKGAQSRTQLVLRAQAQIESQQPALGREAAAALDLWLSQHPRDGQIWDLQGQALGLAQETLRSLRAQAEARAVRFDYVAAIDRLQAAQELGRQMAKQAPLTRSQEIDAAIIDTRLRQLRQLRREQTLQR